MQINTPNTNTSTNNNTSARNMAVSSQSDWTINWGAIFASLVFIYALSWLFFTLTSAIGLNIIEVPDLKNIDTESEGVTITSTMYVWYIVTVFLAYFIGAMLVGKLSNNVDQRAATMHGIVVWSCTIVIAVILTAMGVNNLLGSAAGALKSTANVGMNLSDKAESSQLPPAFQPLIGSLTQGIKKGISQDNPGAGKGLDQIDPQALGLIASALVRGDEKQAKELLASNTGLDEKKIDELVGSVKAKANELGKDIERKAEEAKEYTAVILWLMLIAYVVALIASIYGAKYGARKLASYRSISSSGL